MRGVYNSGVRTPVLAPHLKRRGRGVFLANTVMPWEIMVIFGPNTVVFGQKYKGGRRKGV